MPSSFSFAEAIARLESITTAESVPAIHPGCQSFVRAHEGPTARCFLLIHGYTNCPKQFHTFANLLYERGHTVLVPRMPRHGLADRMTKSLAGLTATELITWLERCLDLAEALGERVDVLGISAGANLAAHAAQHKREVYQSTVIAPVLGTPSIPGWLTPGMTRLGLMLPNVFRWWDPAVRDGDRGVNHAYPRFATHSLAHITRLGRAVMTEARNWSPRASEIIVVLNEADTSVANQPIEQLAARWSATGGNVNLHRIAKHEQMIHDIIDPDQKQQQIQAVYPRLIDLIGA
ncbi:MAG: alpha/beta hydrolase [Oscillochloridaceae bacterium umkhey_bin13]